MRALLAGLAVATCFLSGCGKKESQPPAAKPTKTTMGNPLTAPVDYLGAIGQAKRVAEKVADTAPLKQAIQMFHVSEDRLPKDLNELVKSGYLPALPKAPYRTKFQYDPKTGDVKVVPAE
jgi:hypothetical protein